LFDPTVPHLRNLFASEEGVFPDVDQMCGGDESQSETVLLALRRLGLKKKLAFEDWVERAKFVAKHDNVDRAKLLLWTINQQMAEEHVPVFSFGAAASKPEATMQSAAPAFVFGAGTDKLAKREGASAGFALRFNASAAVTSVDVGQEIVDALRQVAWLPVMAVPDGHGLPWEGDETQLHCASDVWVKADCDLVSAVKPLLDGEPCTRLQELLGLGGQVRCRSALSTCVCGS